MTEYEFEPELDLDLLEDWCDYCDGKSDFDESHFSTILMGVFVANLTPEVDAFLKRFASPFSQDLYVSLTRICEVGPADRELLPWIRRDITSKLALLDEENQVERESIEWLLTNDRFRFTDDVSSLPEIAIASANFDAIYFAESDYVIEHSEKDPRLYALSEALYHIATNYALAHSIMNPLVNGGIDLSNYLEVYLRGGDYVLADDSIVVWQYVPEKPST